MEQEHNFDMRNHAPLSTRARTKTNGVFERATPGSQALERGMVLLRAFLGGAVDLTNAELAERCGLPRSTVSRLTRSLVDGGFLEFDTAQSVYRLAPVCLSLAAGYHHGHGAFAAVLPLLRDAAQREKVNVGLCVQDGTHMVYLASFREGRGPVKRVVNAGTRTPIAFFSSGHALIAALPAPARQCLFERLAETHGAQWPAARARIEQSIAQCAAQGFCTLPSIPGLVGLATTLRTPDGTICSVLLTAPEREDGGHAPELPEVLRRLAREMQEAWVRG